MDLRSVLHAALAALQRGDNKAAHNQLRAFNLKVNALTGKSLTSAQAAVVLDFVNEAIALLSEKFRLF